MERIGRRWEELGLVGEEGRQGVLLHSAGNDAAALEPFLKITGHL